MGNFKKQNKAYNQVKTIDQLQKDLDLMVEKMKTEEYSFAMLNKINNKRCKISILQKQLDTVNSNNKKAY